MDKIKMATFSHLSVDEVNSKRHDENIIVIDIRDSEAYQAGHIPGAVHFDKNELNTFMQNTDKKQAIIFYCYRGISCQTVAQYFSEQGFTEIYSMDGGFEAWQQRYPADK